MSNTRKPRIFDLTKINPDRKAAIKQTACGSYSYSFKRLTPESLDRFSLGYDRAALDILAGKPFIIFEAFYNKEEATRLTPIPEQFTKKEARKLAGGSFNAVLIARYAGDFKATNRLFDYAAVCLDCGRTFATLEAAQNHKCDAPTCPYCGRELNDRREIKAGFCTDCALTRASAVYGYHERPRRSSPLFEKPRSRHFLLHIGAEIEVDGDDGDNFDRDDAARDFSDILNRDPFAPFVQFERDGSLAQGVEVITAPTTYSGYLKRYDAFSSFYNAAIDKGGQFNFSNGLHFHLDKKYFDNPDDPEAVTRAAVLIDYMIYKYFDFYATICKRDRNRFDYARDKHRAKTLLGASMDFYNQSHSNAVNHQNTNTIEIRIFGGYINSAGDFFAALDIANALAKWAKNATLTSAEKATPRDLVKHLHDPARVLAFINKATPNGYHTEAGDKLKNDFIKALKSKLNGGKI